MELTGKVALVTGGTLGIGAATALELARRGANIAVTARNIEGAGEALAAEVRALGRECHLIRGDMSVGQECSAAVAATIGRFGNLHVLVHNAGGPAWGALEELTFEKWRQTFALHVDALFFLCQAALPQMRKNKEGAVITVASSAAVRGVQGAIAYATAKGALPQFTRCLARETADDNIRVNCVAPGVIRTRFHAEMTEERKQLNLDHRIPLHREGTAEQVADVIAFLVTNDYITGETMVIDGGLTSRIV